jgi:transcriptional regulator with XRE-family HTH domain
MYTIGETLKSERLRLGMNQDDFAAAGGVKKRTQIAYEQDERSPDALYLRALTVVGVDVQYILTGEQSASALTPDEKELLSGYRDLDVRGKANMLGMLDVVGTTPKPTASVKYAGKVKQVVEGDQTVNGPLTFGAGEKKKKKTLPE